MRWLPAALLTALSLLPAVGAARGTDDLAGLPDPTRPTPAAGMESGGGGLQSVLISPLRRVAVIDGRVCGVGTRIDGAVVREIHPDLVILRTASGRIKKLRLLPKIKTEHTGGAQDHAYK